MIKRIYNRLLRVTSRFDEKGEYSAGYWNRKIRRKAIELCAGRNGRFLEVGCGEGLFLTELALQRPVDEIWGVDNDLGRVKKAEEKTAEKGIKNIKLSQQNAQGLSFESDYFDTIVCINVLFNMGSLLEVKKSFDEIARVCKRGGSVIFDFRNSLNIFMKIKYLFAKYYDETVKNLPLVTYRQTEINDILESVGLKIIDTIYMTPFLNKFSPIIIIRAGKSA